MKNIKKYLLTKNCRIDSERYDTNKKVVSITVTGSRGANYTVKEVAGLGYRFYNQGSVVNPVPLPETDLIELIGEFLAGKK